MAPDPKRSKAAAAAAAPYVQRLISDEELRDNVRVALESARQAFMRVQHGKAPAKVVLDDKKFKKNMSEATSALKDAADALRSAPKKKAARKRSGGGLLGKLALLAIAAAIAVALNEGLRNKVLDMLFGKEEEFEYSSPSPNGAAAEPAPESVTTT
ncbi:MAG TPA: hypothetical protein VHB30_07780 [Solirubrobacteraceae bacterium]|nr:hypothetical protein [Solirubrobacteraceae bacterium]